MKKLSLNFRHQNVFRLTKKLQQLGFKVKAQSLFDKNIEKCVKIFQQKNKLPVTGEVDEQTMTQIEMNITSRNLMSMRLMKDKHITELSTKYSIKMDKFTQLLKVKGKKYPFLRDGRPFMVFFLPQFCRELMKWGYEPSQLISNYHNRRYEKERKTRYKGGWQEYLLLDCFGQVSMMPHVHESAYCAAAWGRFQIMGYEYKRLGYPSVYAMVSDLYLHEIKHVELYLRLLQLDKELTVLQEKTFDDFHKQTRRTLFLSSEYKKDIKLKNGQFVFE